MHINKGIVKHSNMLEGEKSAKEAAFFMNPHILRGMGGGTSVSKLNTQPGNKLCNSVNSQINAAFWIIKQYEGCSEGGPHDT